MSEPVIVALTPRGAKLGQTLTASLGGEVIDSAGQTRATLERLYREGRPIICIMALGIVVRILGPIACNKHAEPPVVVVDEAGQFAVSVLGGHEGGANALAQRVAHAIGASPVITTASDALHLPPLDLIGHLLGWKIERSEDLTKLLTLAVRGEPIGVYQDAGQRDWWMPYGPWPASFHRSGTWPATTACAGWIVITDREVEQATDLPTVVYRPPSLVAGVGCRRGVDFAEIDALFREVCCKFRLSRRSLGTVATVALKADEPGLVAFADAYGVALRSFSVAELALVGPLPTPSERIRAKVGIAGVAEPAAMLVAGTGRLIVPKQRASRVTLALARREQM